MRNIELGSPYTYLEQLLTVAVSVLSRIVLPDGLRGHVVQRAHLLVLYHTGFVTLDGIGNPKVYQLQVTIHKQEVGGFQVAVDNAYKEEDRKARLGKTAQNNTMHEAIELH